MLSVAAQSSPSPGTGLSHLWLQPLGGEKYPPVKQSLVDSHIPVQILL